MKSCRSFLATAALLALAELSSPCFADAFVDFYLVDEPSDVARGTLLGIETTIISTRPVERPLNPGNGGVVSAVLDGGATFFSDPSRFSSTLPAGDSLGLGASSDFQITFNQPVSNPTLHIFQLSTNVLSFTSGGVPAPFELVKSDGDFIVSNRDASIEGVPDIGDDASGSLLFPGVYSELSWTAVPKELVPLIRGDGVQIQISAIPEPTSFMILGISSLGLQFFGLGRRRRLNCQ